MLNKMLNKVNEKDGKIVISFETSNKKLRNKLLNSDDIEFVRGTVQVKRLIDNNFGFPNWEIYHTEKNVSFGKYEREIVIPLLENDLNIGNFDEVFPMF